MVEVDEAELVQRTTAAVTRARRVQLLVEIAARAVRTMGGMLRAAEALNDSLDWERFIRCVKARDFCCDALVKFGCCRTLEAAGALIDQHASICESRLSPIFDGTDYASTRVFVRDEMLREQVLGQYV